MKIWHEIKVQIEQGCCLYLLTVVKSIGSSPGRVGFKMMVSDSGDLCGSIGGGIMEYNMVEKAKELLKQGNVQPQLIIQDHYGTSTSSSGMICSGSQSIAFNHLRSDDLNLVNNCMADTSMLEFSKSGIKSVDMNTREGLFFNDAEEWLYTELQNRDDIPTAHIFGAGHVSVPTSRLLIQLGFSVHLYDNRKNINTLEENQIVHSKSIIDYAKIDDSVNLNKADYVLLMTHKFTEDKLLLSQLLHHPLKYLGVLGSKNKIAVMFKALLNEGFLQEKLGSVNAPIGLNIKSQTTEEIAVSIVAELIQVKNS